MQANRFLEHLKTERYYQGQLVHIEHIPACEAVWAKPARPLPQALQNALEERGIKRLYSHQALSLDLVRAGKDVVIATGTASGKSLCYNLPVLETLLEDSAARALFIYPTKALAQDQLRHLQDLAATCAGLDLRAGTYDGDTPGDMRRRLREQANCILTNPDMLHAAILPHHPSWAHFLADLRYVVLDEIHTYRGVFGSNVANVIRRLLRIADHYGSRPCFLCASATISNPGELACRLIGRDAYVIDEDGSPRGDKYFALWNPPRLAKDLGRRSPNAEARDLLVKLISSRVQTIAFTRARVVAELIFRYAREELQKLSPGLARAIRAYRGGYLPSERREIERQLFEGELLGVASTNALELGIDVGSLDAALLVGYPGTIASTWQQAGRAGRRSEESLAIMIAHDNPTDQYLVQNPDYLFRQSPENAVLDPDNAYIVTNHLRAAAFELPIQAQEEKAFGRYAPALLEILEENEQLALVGDKWYWRGGGYPAADIDLRNMADPTYTIVDTTGETNQVIGTIDELSAFMQLHTEAIYIHNGETYFCRRLDIEQKVAYVERASVDYYTQSVSDRRVQVEEEDRSKTLHEAKIVFGEVDVTFIVYMYRKIKFYGQDSLGVGQIDLPPRKLATCACWLVPPLEALRSLRAYGRSVHEGMLALANVLTAVIPFHAMCDPSDVGTVVDSSNTGSPSVFVFDLYPGGIGFAERTYELIEDVLQAGLQLVRQCDCQMGCPSCVGSPVASARTDGTEGGLRGHIPDKEGALVVLHYLLGLEPYIPKYPPPGGTAKEAAAGRRRSADPLPLSLEKRIRRQVKHLNR